MTISAKIVADSVSSSGIRLTTLQLKYPKFIHGECKTHRLLRMNDNWVDVMEETGLMDDPNLSRNASSSRAIPVERLIRDVIEDPVYPSFWGKNQAGMQAVEECNHLVHIGNRWIGESGIELRSDVERKIAWDLARSNAIRIARAYFESGYHKQIVNRLLEPFCHINVVVTATEWSNFFALRCHKDAQPEMRLLAEAMRGAMSASEPRPLKVGEWHLPYVDQDDGRGHEITWNEKLDDVQMAIRVSVARCARVSYLTQEGKKPNVEEDLKLYDRLVGAAPIHASPAEHQATPDRWDMDERGHDKWHRPELHGNLRGWIQYRKTLEGECQ